VGGAANQLLLSSRGSDALLATTWSRQLRVNARCDIWQEIRFSLL
jgi:hypothetical protein